jgi:choline dehydrogenase-like flavoprotein
MIRPPSEAFEYVDRNGYRLWPASVTRAVLDPYFAKVEAEMNIRRARWDEVPMPGIVFAQMFANMGLTCDRVPFPYVDCLQCGYCEAACRFDRKRSLILNYIPKAEHLGAEFRCDAQAWRIAPHPSGYQVFYRQADGREASVVGRRVIVAANAIESAALLLRSKPELRSLPSGVGKNFHNNGDLAWFWELPEGRFPTYWPYKGRNNAVMMAYGFWESDRIAIHTGCVPPGVFAGTEFYRDEDGPLGRPWGLEHKHWARKLYQKGLFIGAIATGLTDGEGEVTIDGQGRPQVSIPVTPTMQAYHDRVMGIARRIAAANGATVLKSSKRGYERGGAHLLGTCRMGDDPARSVCDPNGEVRNYPGLFCTDSSVCPGAAGVNPSLMIAGNAERIAAHLVATA